jgi:hypothetical protein
MNVTTSVGSILNYKTKPRKDWLAPQEVEDIKWREGVLNEQDTYWLIFNKDAFINKEGYDYITSYPGIKIVYQSEPAVNGNYGYEGRRNFLLVFEYEKPIQPLPEVQSQGE